jgi:murein DD-endopeptidase MepM/ murein hydrolase activator NlpD
VDDVDLAGGNPALSAVGTDARQPASMELVRIPAGAAETESRDRLSLPTREKTMKLRNTVACLALLVAAPVFAGTPGTPSRQGDGAAALPDAFTPVLATPIGARHFAFRGTDDLYHVVYEIELTNTKAATATLQRIEVVDAAAPTHVIATYAGKDLVGNLRTLQPAPAGDARIPANASRLFYVELAFKDAAAMPQALLHRLTLLGAANPGPHTPATPLYYTVARVPLDRAPLPLIEPPLRGDGWVAANGCCNSLIVHRGSLQSINGALFNSQRFAIDWMRLDKNGELVHGDPAAVRDYTDYGAKVYAVADGTVVETLDDLSDQVPGTLPDPATITLRTVDGNHVILDIGNGLYAFYAHLGKGSVTVHEGQRIKAGTVIGELGNTGNTSAPHLHFHIMDGPSAMGSQGVPYLIRGFTRVGQVDVQKFNDSDVLTGHWGKPLPRPVAEHARFPMDLNVVDFEGPAANGSKPGGGH